MLLAHPETQSTGTRRGAARRELGVSRVRLARASCSSVCRSALPFSSLLFSCVSCVSCSPIGQHLFRRSTEALAIMADAWTANTSSATELRLVGGRVPSRVFAPTFTYAIFGDAEAAWGYQGLRIDLALGQTTLRPALHVHWQQKNTHAGKTVDDPQKTLLEFLPEQPDTLVASSDEAHEAHLALVAQEQTGSVPLGQRVSSFSISPRTAKGKGKGKESSKRAAFFAPDTGASDRSEEHGTPGSASATASEPGSRHFDIYLCSWDTPGFGAFFLRLRLLTLLFIEGASYFDVNEPGWEFLLLYERSHLTNSDGTSNPSYHFVGFTSLYHFWVYPDQARIRLSQFLILPPYQHQGLGKRLYAAVYNRVALLSQRPEPYLPAPEVKVKVSELTVEDPSEEFDALRDRCDLMRLLRPAQSAALAPYLATDEGNSTDSGHASSTPFSIPIYTDVSDALHAGKLLPPLDPVWSQTTQRRLCLASRQWARLLEMVTLLAITDAFHDTSAQARSIWKEYRLMVKTRLYRKNADVLEQLDTDTRRIKLQETYENVVYEYADRVGAEVMDEHVRALLPADLVPEDEDEIDGLEESEKQGVDLPPKLASLLQPAARGDKRTLEWLESQLEGPAKRSRT